MKGVTQLDFSNNSISDLSALPMACKMLRGKVNFQKKIRKLWIFRVGENVNGQKGKVDGPSNPYLEVTPTQFGTDPNPY